MNEANTIRYWPERRPFLANVSYPATIVRPAATADGKARLRVENTDTKRHYFVEAARSNEPAPGCWTQAEAVAPAVVLTPAPAPPPIASPKTMRKAPAESE
jgi:hypothetical protein